MRPTLATLGTLYPLESPASKYRLSARLRKLRITGGNVIRQAANVKSRLTPDCNRRRLGRQNGYRFSDGKGKGTGVGRSLSGWLGFPIRDVQFRGCCGLGVNAQAF
jgi:hypothetical protein